MTDEHKNLKYWKLTLESVKIHMQALSYNCWWWN